MPSSIKQLVIGTVVAIAMAGVSVKALGSVVHSAAINTPQTVAKPAQ
jgi:hypothetical protein